MELSPQGQAKLSLIYESALEKDYVVKVIGDKQFVLTEREARKLTDRQGGYGRGPDPGGESFQHRQSSPAGFLHDLLFTGQCSGHLPK